MVLLKKQKWLKFIFQNQSFFVNINSCNQYNYFLKSGLLGFYLYKPLFQVSSQYDGYFK